MEAFVEYQRGRAFSGKTIRRRATAINSFLDFMEPAGLAEATPNDVEEWLRGFPGAQTRYSYRSDIKMLYRWAVRRSLAGANPVDDTDPPRLPKRLPRPLQPADLAAALAVADGDVQLMLLLGAFAGLRVSEIAGLSVAAVHLDRDPPVLFVEQGKGRKDRVVPLHPTLCTRLRGLSPGWVFPGRDGHLTANTVSKRIASVFELVSLEAVPHQLRHTFGTEFARVAKGNLVAVAEVMGHESISTTKLYVGWSPETAKLIGEMYAS
jgi:integrase